MPTPVITDLPEPMLTDTFGRHINYARLSVTDRCDFRCVYCMAEDMEFLPRSEILSLEEIYAIAQGLVHAGINKLRLTGGEPLIRRNILWLIEKLGVLEGLQELTLTTNGSQLSKYASELARLGVQRINISLDSLDPIKFKQITRTGNLEQVIEGIDAARTAGFKQIKLNSVIMKQRNDEEILDLVNFSIARNIDIAFIEEMPLGEINEHDRAQTYCSSDDVRQRIEQQHKLLPSKKTTSGPSRYFRLDNSNSHVGFISPHSNNFCSDCNRVRVTVEGRLLMCLGNEHSVDLRTILRNQTADKQALTTAIKQGLLLKPERHYFDLNSQPDIVRFMNMTGG